MKTKHTKEDWKILNDDRFKIIIGTENETICTIAKHSWSTDDSEQLNIDISSSISKQRANANLITLSLKSYELILKSYLITQIQSDIDVVFAVTTDSLRAYYTYYISCVTGIECREVKETIERFSYMIRNKEISFPEAMNKLS